MATETQEYLKALEFMEEVKLIGNFIRDPELPVQMTFSPPIPYLSLGLWEDRQYFLDTGKWKKTCKVFAPAWTELEAVMIITDEEDFLSSLKGKNFEIIGASAKGESDIYNL